MERVSKSERLGEADYGAMNEMDSIHQYHIPAFVSSNPHENKSVPMVNTGLNGGRKVAQSVDDFTEPNTSNLYKALRTGRQRKKNAARSKGGEFQAKRKKRRLYFCCVSSEIDVEKLADYFSVPRMGLKGKIYDEVLHLYMDKIDELAIPTHELYRTRSVDALYGVAENAGAVFTINDVHDPNLLDLAQVERTNPTNYPGLPPFYERTASDGPRRKNSFDVANNAYTELFNKGGVAVPAANVDVQSTAAFWNYGGKEVFVFDFGAIVFWGYHRSEVSGLIDLIRRDFIDQAGALSVGEFEAGEDDMAFVTSSEVDGISIANDVITLPDIASVKSRLAVSFAIAQSSVLSIFEARVETKIEDYKYIPEELAAHGKVRLPPKQLANMIGEVFVIRHDVNLHSEILDIPDYFWKEDAVEPLYRMAMDYLEMEPRTEVLNKRLDLLRELLRVLQQQHENAHNVKLEWIIIWLIVISVVLEVWTIAVEVIALVTGIKVPVVVS